MIKEPSYVIGSFHTIRGQKYIVENSNEYNAVLRSLKTGRVKNVEIKNVKKSDNKTLLSLDPSTTATGWVS